MTFGKYKGYSLSEIYEQDSNYIYWLLSDKFDDVNVKVKPIVKEFLESIKVESKVINNIMLQQRKEIVLEILNEALEIEDYLLAAEVRDELNLINNQLNQNIQRKSLLSIENVKIKK